MIEKIPGKKTKCKNSLQKNNFSLGVIFKDFQKGSVLTNILER